MSADTSNSSPSSIGLDRDIAFYKLRFFNDPRGQNLLEANGRIQLEGSYEKNIFRIYAKTNTDLKVFLFGRIGKIDVLRTLWLREAIVQSEV